LINAVRNGVFRSWVEKLLQFVHALGTSFSSLEEIVMIHRRELLEDIRSDISEAEHRVRTFVVG
jgi:hypothetical protein